MNQNTWPIWTFLLAENTGVFQPSAFTWKNKNGQGISSTKFWSHVFCILHILLYSEACDRITFTSHFWYGDLPRLWRRAWSPSDRLTGWLRRLTKARQIQFGSFDQRQWWKGGLSMFALQPTWSSNKAYNHSCGSLDCLSFHMVILLQISVCIRCLHIHCFSDFHDIIHGWPSPKRHDIGHWHQKEPRRHVDLLNVLGINRRPSPRWDIMRRILTCHASDDDATHS